MRNVKPVHIDFRLEVEPKLAEAEQSKAAGRIAENARAEAAERARRERAKATAAQAKLEEASDRAAAAESKGEDAERARRAEAQKAAAANAAAEQARARAVECAQQERSKAVEIVAQAERAQAEVAKRLERERAKADETQAKLAATEAKLAAAEAKATAAEARAGEAETARKTAAKKAVRLESRAARARASGAEAKNTSRRHRRRPATSRRQPTLGRTPSAKPGALNLGRSASKARPDPVSLDVPAAADPAAEVRQALAAVRNKSLESPRLQRVLKQVARQVDLKDASPEDHSLRVSRMARKLAEAKEITGPHLLAITIAGLVHDIGKSCIPDAIIEKARPSREDMELIRRYAEFGVELLEPLPCMEPVLQTHQSFSAPC